jgi:superfamily II DNA or RNA helicase
MSKTVPLASLSDEEKSKIEKDLTITLEPSKYGFAPSTEIYAYKVEKDKAVVPFSYDIPNAFIRQRSSFTSMGAIFTGELREEQKIVREEIIKELNSKRAVLLSLHVGFGKTILAINIATKIKLKTLVIVNRIVLIKQWEEAITTFCPNAKIQFIKPGDKMKDDIDFYIINALNIVKNDSSFYKSIGLVIIDELHLILAEGLSAGLLELRPSYLIGLSATAYRMDNLNKLFNLYFGSVRIERKLWHPHKVIKIDTGFNPKTEITKTGKVDWNSILEAQASDVNRNELIISLVKKHKTKTFLIPVKRVEHGRYLLTRLKEEGESVDSLIGKSQKFDKNVRILIGTASKIGTGFDHAKLNAMILATDIEAYFIQYLGRIFRRKDVEPVIFDLVDDHPILKKHFKTRCGVYKEHGGVLINGEVDTNENAESDNISCKRLLKR